MFAAWRMNLLDGHGMPKNSIRVTLTGWIRDAGFEPEDLTVEPDQDWTWGVGFQGRPFRVSVFERGGTSPGVAVQIGLIVGEEHQSAIKNLQPWDRARFNYLFREELLRRPIGFQVRLDEERAIEHVAVGTNLYEDPLTRAGFLRRLHQVQNAALHSVMLLNQLQELGPWWPKGER